MLNNVLEREVVVAELILRLGVGNQVRCVVGGVEEKLRVVGGVLGLHQAVKLWISRCFLAEDRVAQSGRVDCEVLEMIMNFTRMKNKLHCAYWLGVLLCLAVLDSCGYHGRCGVCVELFASICAKNVSKNYKEENSRMASTNNIIGQILLRALRLRS